MAVDDRRGCDGCDRTLPVADLAAVTLGDEQAVCCPDCRELAESVVEQTGVGRPGGERGRGECSGCDETHPVDAFEMVTLPNGSTVACCSACREHAESMSRRTAVEGTRGECSGCGEAFDVSDMAVVELDDGTTVACCETCAEYARAAARTSGDQQDDGAEAASGGASGEDATAAPGADGETDSSGAGRSGSTRADAPAVCDQCGEWVDVEPFEVVTVDERVEEFCPACTNRARQNGVVADVRMRRAEAYDRLDVDRACDEATLRDAYLTRIKMVHPDREGGSEAAFRRVKRAYERLTDDSTPP